MPSRKTTMGTGSIASAIAGGFAEYFMTNGLSGWIPLAAGLVGAGASLAGHWLVDRRRSASSPNLLTLDISNSTTVKPAFRQEERKKNPHELLGARTGKFELFRAACLLGGDEPQWPLPTERAKEKYATLIRTIGSQQLDDPEVPTHDTISFDLGWREEDRSGRSTLHELEIDRRTLRKYLQLDGRPIPEFLEERFDCAVMPVGSDD